MGSILVEMKKNSVSRHLRTGRMASAYAAGRASSSTRTVEPIVGSAEGAICGHMPRNSRGNSDKVGRKVNLGGQVSAADSGLNAVITIHSTGRKKAMPTTHPRAVQPALPENS